MKTDHREDRTRVVFVFEPIVINTLQFKERTTAGYSGRIGIGVRY